MEQPPFEVLSGGADDEMKRRAQELMRAEKISIQDITPLVARMMLESEIETIRKSHMRESRWMGYSSDYVEPVDREFLDLAKRAVITKIKGAVVAERANRFFSEQYAKKELHKRFDEVIAEWLAK